MKRNIISAFGLLVLLAWAAPNPVSGAVIRIAKSYPEFEVVLDSENAPTYEFRMSHVSHIDWAMQYQTDGSSYRNNLNPEGMTEIIFEDSETYDVAAEIAADTVEAPNNFSAAWPIFTQWQLGPNVFKGFKIYTSGGHSPTIDISGVPTGIWGGNNLMHCYYMRDNDTRLEVRDINFVSTRGDNTGDPTGFFRIAETLGGQAPDMLFENCTFNTGWQVIFLQNLAGTNHTLTFRQCGFRMPPPGQSGHNRLSFGIGIPGVTTLFEKCTFIGAFSDALDGDSNPIRRGWSVYWDDEQAVSFNLCLFYNMAATGQFATPTAYDNCLDFTTGGDPTLANTIPGTGNLTATDPMFVNPATSFDLLAGSPAILPGDNIGFYQGDGEGPAVNSAKRSWLIY